MLAVELRSTGDFKIARSLSEVEGGCIVQSQFQYPSNMTNYTSPKPELWTGRRVDPALPPQYWHQIVEFVDLREPLSSLADATVIIGYAVDEGVRRNQGRVGAAAGPDVARGHLGRLAYHGSPARVLDGGNVVCPDGDLEAAQETLSQLVEVVCRAGGRPVVIGGGHDMAYGHFRGLHRAYAGEGKRFGVINFDAHLDLRDPKDGATSGTPFRHILDEFGTDTKYLAIGIQRAANTPELFATAARLGVGIIEDHEIIDNHSGPLNRIHKLLAEVDYLYTTVDLDGFHAGVAPGVSAPNPTGFDPHFVLQGLRYLVPKSKLVGFDVAEFNPGVDRDGITGRLVGRLVFGQI